MSTQDDSLSVKDYLDFAFGPDPTAQTDGTEKTAEVKEEGAEGSVAERALAHAQFSKGAAVALRAALNIEAPAAETNSAAAEGQEKDAAAAADDQPLDRNDALLRSVREKLAGNMQSHLGGVEPDRNTMEAQPHHPGGIEQQLGTTEAAMDFTRRAAKQHVVADIKDATGQSPAKEPEVRQHLTTTPEKGGLKYASAAEELDALLAGEEG